MGCRTEIAVAEHKADAFGNGEETGPIDPAREAARSVPPLGASAKAGSFRDRIPAVRFEFAANNQKTICALRKARLSSSGTRLASRTRRISRIPGPPSLSYFIVLGSPSAWQKSSWERRAIQPARCRRRSKRSTASAFRFPNSRISQRAVFRPTRCIRREQSHSFSTEPCIAPKRGFRRSVPQCDGRSVARLQCGQIRPAFRPQARVEPLRRNRGRSPPRDRTLRLSRSRTSREFDCGWKPGRGCAPHKCWLAPPR